MSRAVPSGFRQSRGHSRHGYFIDLRHIICTACLQAGFHSSGSLCLGKLLPTSRALRRKAYCTVPACRSFKVGVLRRYPLIPPIGIPVCKVLLPCTQPFQLRTCRTCTKINVLTFRCAISQAAITVLPNAVVALSTPLWCASKALAAGCWSGRNVPVKAI